MDECKRLEAGGAVEVWDRHAPAPALIDRPGEITPDSAAEDVRSWQARGYRLLSILDDDYPVHLRGVQQAPPIIFTLGSVIADDPAVSVVGSRKASAAGLAMATDLARALTSRYMTVVAGLARGIDNAAHREGRAEGPVSTPTRREAQHLRTGPPGHGLLFTKRPPQAGQVQSSGLRQVVKRYRV